MATRRPHFLPPRLLHHRSAGGSAARAPVAAPAPAVALGGARAARTAARSQRATPADHRRADVQRARLSCHFARRHCRAPERQQAHAVLLREERDEILLECVNGAGHDARRHRGLTRQAGATRLTSCALYAGVCRHRHPAVWHVPDPRATKRCPEPSCTELRRMKSPRSTTPFAAPWPRASQKALA